MVKISKVDVDYRVCLGLALDSRGVKGSYARASRVT